MNNQLHYQEEIEHLSKIEDPNDECNGQREIYDDITIERLKQMFPTLPEDYWIYLKEIGLGSFDNGMFMIYSSPCTLEELGLSGTYPNIPNNYVFFGDGLSGDLSGFDLLSTKDEVIEFWHEMEKIEPTKKTFRQYIRQKMRLKNKKK